MKEYIKDLYKMVNDVLMLLYVYGKDVFLVEWFYLGEGYKWYCLCFVIYVYVFVNYFNYCLGFIILLFIDCSMKFC